MGSLTEQVRSYFAACSCGDGDAVSAHFTPDARIYDTNHPPLVGAEAIGRFWASIHRKWDGASWHVDTAVEQGSSVAIEWTMRGQSEDRPMTVRGSEHYEFRDGFIRQIRQYWTFNEDDPTTELLEYPYADDDRFQ